MNEDEDGRYRGVYCNRHCTFSCSLALSLFSFSCAFFLLLQFFFAIALFHPLPSPFPLPLSPFSLPSSHPTNVNMTVKNNVRSVEGTLTAVTVFRDRAQVTYEVKTTLSRGTHTLRLQLDGAYESWKSNTLQVRLVNPKKQPVVLHDVRGHVSTTTLNHCDRIGELQEKLAEAQDRVVVAQMAVDNSKALTEMIDSIEKMQLQERKELGREEGVPTRNYLANPSKWTEMADFLTSRRSEIEAKCHDQIQEVVKAESRVKKLTVKLEKLQSLNYTTVSHHAVDATVGVYSAVEPSHESVELPVSLLFSFIVFGASWDPLYDLRVLSPTGASDEPHLDLTYYGEVTQVTNQDWEKVSLSLSTAVPHVGASPPSFSTPFWHISLKRPRSFRVEPRLMAMGAYKRHIAFDQMDACQSMPQMDVSPMIEEATVPTNTFITATDFAIAGQVTVRADGQKNRLMVAHRRFPVSLTYMAVPQKDTRVYLIGKAKNTSPFQLLKGPSNVFYNNTFVNKSVLAYVSPEEEFSVSLGSDDAVAVTFTDVGKKTTSVSGSVFSGKKSVSQYHYLFKVENTLTTGVTNVVLRDHYPISSDPDSLKITLQSPDPKLLKEFESKFAEGAAVNPDDNMVEWHMRLKPKEKRTVELIFQARYQKDAQVLGLT